MLNTEANPKQNAALLLKIDFVNVQQSPRLSNDSIATGPLKIHARTSIHSFSHYILNVCWYFTLESVPVSIILYRGLHVWGFKLNKTKCYNKNRFKNQTIQNPLPQHFSCIFFGLCRHFLRLDGIFGLMHNRIIDTSVVKVSFWTYSNCYGQWKMAYADFQHLHMKITFTSLWIRFATTCKHFLNKLFPTAAFKISILWNIIYIIEY